MHTAFFFLVFAALWIVCCVLREAQEEQEGNIPGDEVQRGGDLPRARLNIVAPAYPIATIAFDFIRYCILDSTLIFTNLWCLPRCDQLSSEFDVHSWLKVRPKPSLGPRGKPKAMRNSSFSWGFLFFETFLCPLKLSRLSTCSLILVTRPFESSAFLMPKPGTPWLLQLCGVAWKLILKRLLENWATDSWIDVYRLYINIYIYNKFKLVWNWGVQGPKADPQFPICFVVLFFSSPLGILLWGSRRWKLTYPWNHWSKWERVCRDFTVKL